METNEPIIEVYEESENNDDMILSMFAGKSTLLKTPEPAIELHKKRKANDNIITPVIAEKSTGLESTEPIIEVLKKKKNIKKQNVLVSAEMSKEPKIELHRKRKANEDPIVTKKAKK